MDNIYIYIYIYVSVSVYREEYLSWQKTNRPPGKGIQEIRPQTRE